MKSTKSCVAVGASILLFFVCSPNAAPLESDGPNTDLTATENGNVALPASKKPVKYVSPKGFAGYTWGQSFTEFDRLKPNPVTLQVAYSGGRTQSVEYFCTPTGTTDCDLGSALSTLRQKVQGRGFHLFSEFVVPNQGFRFESTGVVLYPVTYQFCAKWDGESSKPPEDILQHMELCGVRMVFRSQTLAELATLTDEQLTNYELVLEELIRNFGKPAKYFRKERVVIETPDGKIADPRERRFKTWRWCPPIGFSFVPTCEASIVLGFSPESGNGVILYATPQVWEFADARENSTPGSDPLYKFLHVR
jgi:hypothetical protein